MNRSRFALIPVAAALAFGNTASHGQDDNAVERGNATFEHSCAPCHGDGPGDDGRDMLPGTAALQIKYQGTIPALLEERIDLNYEVLRVFLRQGSMSMPPFRPTELSDADIRDIAAYLARTASAAASGRN